MIKLLICLVFTTLSSNLFAFDRETFIAMSDQELFKAGLYSLVGKCEIRDKTKDPNSECDYYTYTGQMYSSIHTKTFYNGRRGLPHGNGSGCVVAPTIGKK